MSKLYADVYVNNRITRKEFDFDSLDFVFRKVCQNEIKKKYLFFLYYELSKDEKIKAIELLWNIIKIDNKDLPNFCNLKLDTLLNEIEEEMRIFNSGILDIERVESAYLYYIDNVELV